MIAQFWEDVAVTVRPDSLQDEGALLWLAAVTHPNGQYGYMASMNPSMARKLRDALNAALDGVPDA